MAGGRQVLGAGRWRGWGMCVCVHWIWCITFLVSISRMKRWHGCLWISSSLEHTIWKLATLILLTLLSLFLLPTKIRMNICGFHYFCLSAKTKEVSISLARKDKQNSESLTRTDSIWQAGPVPSSTFSPLATAVHCFTCHNFLFLRQVG